MKQALAIAYETKRRAQAANRKGKK
jgi:hypothetical protein